MAVCNINDLLEDGACFVQLPDFMLQAAAVQLWCQISGGVVPPPAAPGGWWNDEIDSPIVNPDEGDGPIVNPDI